MSEPSVPIAAAGDSSADIDALSARLSTQLDRANQLVPDADMLRDALAKREQAENQARTFIAYLVLSTYCGALVLILLLWMWLSVWHASFDKLEAIVDLIKTALVPVVTLVLGYYLAKPREGSGTRQ